MGTIAPDRDVKALCEKHAAGIEQLRAKVGNNISHDAEYYNDTWLLRFLLSHNLDIAEAESAVRQTLAWRKEKHDWLDVSGAAA